MENVPLGGGRGRARRNLARQWRLVVLFERLAHRGRTGAFLEHGGLGMVESTNSKVDDAGSNCCCIDLPSIGPSLHSITLNLIITQATREYGFA